RSAASLKLRQAIAECARYRRPIRGLRSAASLKRRWRTRFAPCFASIRGLRSAVSLKRGLHRGRWAADRAAIRGLRSAASLKPVEHVVAGNREGDDPRTQIRGLIE